MRAATERAEPRRGWPARTAFALPWLVIAAPALWQLVLLGSAIAGRLLYPYDLEWMEGGLLHHALRIQQGQGIYVPPSIDFIPYLYTPFYPAMLALLATPLGLSYTFGRAVSLVGLLGIAVVTITSLGGAAHQHARRAPVVAAILLALGLFAAGYPYVEGWYDLVRADTFFLFLVTGALAALPRWCGGEAGTRGQARVAAAGAILALAFFCKQTGILYVALGGLIVLVVNWRRLPGFVLSAGAIGLGGCALLQVTTDGWFWIYVRKIHAAHDFNPDRFWKSFENILWFIPAQSIVIGAALVLVLLTWAVRRRLPRQVHSFLLWTLTYAVSTLLGAIGWGTEFAHFNAYMPALLHGGLAAGAGVLAVFACGHALVGDRRGWEIVATVLGLAAAAPLAYACYTKRWDPNKYVPTAQDRLAGDRLIAHLRAIEGDVWMPSHPWYLQLAGKQPRVHRMGIKDVTTRQARTVAGLDDALRTHAFAAIVLDARDVHLELPVLTATYRLQEKLPKGERPRVFTGAPVVPDSIWVPAVPAQPPAGTRTAFDLEMLGWIGWTTSGAAWGPRPASEPLPGQGPVIGATGRRFATSMHGGDAGTGRLTSPPFVLGKTLTLHLGGGVDDRLRVELWVGDAIVATARVAPPGGEALQATTLDTAAHVGPYQAKLVFVDDAPTGHLTVDDIWIGR